MNQTSWLVHLFHLIEAEPPHQLAGAQHPFRSGACLAPVAVVPTRGSSRFTADEIAGFAAAADDRDLHALDLVWITNSDNAMVPPPR